MYLLMETYGNINFIFINNEYNEDKDGLFFTFNNSFKNDQEVLKEKNLLKRCRVFTKTKFLSSRN